MTIEREATRRHTRAIVLRSRGASRRASLPALGLVERWRRPRGVHVVLVGPDGAGKSTLAEALPALCGDIFPRSTHMHWRPGLLPRPGAILNRKVQDGHKPHYRSAHGRGLSLLLLLYYWLDFTVGGLIRVQRPRARGSLVVVERGWWDIAVDPARYRLAPMGGLVRLLGHLVPSPELVLLLEAPAEEIHRRKRDLPVADIQTQSAAWREVVPRSVVLTGDADRVAASARKEIASLLETRAVSRHGAGWLAVPSRARPRWLLPRGPGQTAKTGLRAYNPVTVRAQAGWHLARALAPAGTLRVFPRAAGPDPEIRALLAPYLSSGGSLAISESISRPGRLVALLIDSRGRETAVAKVALDDPGRAQLDREAGAIERLAPLLRAPVEAPTMLARRPGLVLYEPVAWRPLTRPWRLEPDVAAALGAFHAETGGAHGDFAPWNLLRTEEGWTLIDWEDVVESASPFLDLAHFVLSGALLLGRPEARAIRRGLSGGGWIGEAVAAYADAAGLERIGARGAFLGLLETSFAGEAGDRERLRVSLLGRG